MPKGYPPSVFVSSTCYDLNQVRADNCTEVKPECERLISLISTFSQNILEQLESIPKLLDEEVDKAASARERGEEYVARLHLTFTLPNSDEIAAEFQRLNQMLPKLL